MHPTQQHRALRHSGRAPRVVRGYVLLPVVLAMTLIAAIAFLLNSESPMNVHQSAGQWQAAQVRYVTEAGLNHALWQTRQAGCGPYSDNTNQTFGNGSYTTTLTTDLGSTTNHTLTVDQDTWIRSDLPTTNNATDTKLHIRYEGGIIERPMYRYDLSPLSANATILSATAWFYVSKEHPQGPADIHRMTADWTETDATWDTMGDNLDSAVLATIPTQPVAGVWVPINLTAQVQAWVNGQDNYGITLNSTSEATHGDYASREAAQQPYLEVIVGTPPSSPATLQAVGTLANGVSRTITRDVALYQSASYSFLQLEAGSGKDAMVDGFYNSRNHGNYELKVSSDPGWLMSILVQFDLAAIPTGSRVISAQLQLYHTGTTAAGADAGATVHRVTRDWVEGTKSGGGQADGATWDTYDGTNAWATAGGDYDSVSIANSSITAATADWESWDIKTLAQGWLGGSFPNNGLLLKGSGNVNVAFASKEDADPALHPKLSITYACECGQACLAPQGSGKVLMVVQDKANPDTHETSQQALLESWGYSVQLISEDESQAAFDTAFGNNDVVYMTGSASPPTVGTKLSNAPIGVVNGSGALNDELGISLSRARPIGTGIEVTDNSHYITAPFATGGLSVYTAAMRGLTATGALAPGLQTLAQWGTDTSLAVLDQGATLVGGGTSAARLAVLPFGRAEGSNLDWRYVNNNGHLILQRALQWGIGATGGVPPKNLLFVSGGSVPTTQEQLRIDLIESWGYSVNLISDNDTQANFDAATAAHDVAYVSQEVRQNDLGTKLVSATIGVVNEETDLYDEFGVAERSWTANTQTAINIIDNTHYITSPFTTGNLTFLTSSQTIAVIDGAFAIAPGLQTLAETASGTTNIALSALDTGATTWDGGSAPGRRVQLPWGPDAFDINGLNADGQTIMRRAIEWAGGAGCGSLKPLLLVVGDATTLSSKDAGRKALMQSWCYKVTVIDDGESQANFDAAAAAADVMYVSGTINGGTLAHKLTGSTTAIVNEFYGKLDNFGFSSSTSSTVNADTFSTTDAAHYITESFSANPVTVFTGSLSMPVPGGTLASELQNVGEVSGTPALVTMDTGAMRYDGNPASARRVHLPFGAADTTDLTADGETIMQRAIEWGAGAGSLAWPIAHWKLDDGSGGTAVDSEGGHNGTLAGDLNWGSGQLDGALLFDGLDDRVNVPHDDTLSLTDAFTLSAWINSYTLSGYDVVLNKGTSGNNQNYWFGTLDDEITFGFYTGTWQEFNTSGLNLQQNTWYHIAATFDDASDQVRLYLGGSEVLSTSTTVSPTPNTDDLQIGRSQHGEYWGGKLDDIRVYDRVLSAAEVADLASAGGGGGGGSGTVVYESFEEYIDADNDSASISVAKPAGTAAGDLLIATVVVNRNNESSLVADDPAWTLLTVDSQANAMTVGVWWKVVGGSEPSSYSFSWGSGARSYSWIMRFSGNDPTNPINVWAKYGEGGTLNPLSPAVTTTVDATLILRIGGFDDDDITIGDPGMAGHTPIKMQKSNTGTGTVSGGAAYVGQAASGDSGTANFTLTASEQARTVTIAIAPAP